MLIVGKMSQDWNEETAMYAAINIHSLDHQTKSMSRHNGRP